MIYDCSDCIRYDHTIDMFCINGHLQDVDPIMLSWCDECGHIKCIECNYESDTEEVKPPEYLYKLPSKYDVFNKYVLKKYILGKDTYAADQMIRYILNTLEQYERMISHKKHDKKLYKPSNYTFIGEERLFQTRSLIQMFGIPFHEIINFFDRE